MPTPGGALDRDSGGIPPGSTITKRPVQSHPSDPERRTIGLAKLQSKRGSHLWPHGWFKQVSLK